MCSDGGAGALLAAGVAVSCYRLGECRDESPLGSTRRGSECSEISENSERLANARAGLRLQASLHDGAVRGGGAWR